MYSVKLLKIPFTQSVTLRGQRVSPLHQNNTVNSPHCSLFISYDNEKENFIINQEPLKFMIIPVILMTFTIDSKVVL